MTFPLTSSNWPTSRLRFVATVSNSNVDKKSYDGQETVRLCNYVDVYYNERITADIDFMEATASRSEIAQFQLRKGDVIITKDSETPDDIGIPALVAEDMPSVVCGYHLTVLRANEKVLPEFLFRTLQAQSTRAYFELETPGVTRFGLDLDTIGSMPLALPPLDMQRQVCDHLDRATTRVDALIAKKTRFIDLLREKRRALIAHTLSRGLDAGVPMKDSGVEWLGEAPVTWDVAPLRVFLTLRRDVVGTASATTKLLSLTLQGVIERDLENPTGKMPASFDSYQRVSPGDMVFCLFDMDETPRTVGVSPQEGMITGAYTVFRPSSDLWASFLYYFFLHVDEYKRLRPFYKGLRKTIRPGPFLSIQVPRPPVVVAEEIVAYLNRATSRIDALLSKTERSIELLREHRTALITAAVTGKIDLREAA